MRWILPVFVTPSGVELGRDGLESFSSGIYDYDNGEIVAENTDRMIDLALSYAAEDEVVLAEVRQRLEQKGFELVVGSIDLVNQQHRWPGVAR